MSYRDVILADRPVGCWPCNDSGGPLDIVTGVRGTFVGSPVVGVPAFPGERGMKISSSYVDSGENSGTFAPTTLSVEAWFWLSGTGAATATLIGKRATSAASLDWAVNNDGAANYGPSFTVFNNAGGAFAHAGGDIRPGFTSPPSGIWHHYAGTFDGTTTTIAYGDGQIAATATGVSGTRNPLSTSDVSVGASADGTSPWMPGVVCWGAVYNYVLSPAQVRRHYLTGVGEGFGQGLWKPDRRRRGR